MSYAKRLVKTWAELNPERMAVLNGWLSKEPEHGADGRFVSGGGNNASDLSAMASHLQSSTGSGKELAQAHTELAAEHTELASQAKAAGDSKASVMHTLAAQEHQVAARYAKAGYTGEILQAAQDKAATRSAQAAAVSAR
jgi:hypothetical protein